MLVKRHHSHLFQLKTPSYGTSQQVKLLERDYRVQRGSFNSDKSLQLDVGAEIGDVSGLTSLKLCSQSTLMKDAAAVEVLWTK